MSILKHLQQKVTMSIIQRQCMIIVTLLSTLCLLELWPRFHDDAMSVEWYVYLIMIIIFAIPLFKKNKTTD